MFHERKFLSWIIFVKFLPWFTFDQKYGKLKKVENNLNYSLVLHKICKWKIHIEMQKKKEKKKNYMKELYEFFLLHLIFENYLQIKIFISFFIGEILLIKFNYFLPSNFLFIVLFFKISKLQGESRPRKYQTQEKAWN